MTNLLIAAGVIALVAINCRTALWGIRQQHRADRAEMDLWADLSGTRGHPIPLAGPAPLALGQTTPPTVYDLAAWDMAVDGLPFLALTDFRPMDVVADPESYLPRLGPAAPVSTARLRRIAA